MLFRSKKLEAFERKEEDLAKKTANITATQNEVNLIKKSQLEMLEKISGLTQDDAKKYLLDSVESQVRHESAMKIKEIEAQCREEAEQTAREIIAPSLMRILSAEWNTLFPGLERLRSCLQVMRAK